MNDNTKRLLIFIAVSAGILFFYNKVFTPPNTAKNSQQPGKAAVNASGTSSGSASPAIVLETKPAAKPKSEKTYTLENDLVKITFSNIGGGIIKSCLLKRYSD